MNSACQLGLWHQLFSSTQDLLQTLQNLFKVTGPTQSRSPAQPQALCELIAPLAKAQPLHVPSMEDRALKFIEGHNREIWIGIAVLAALVVFFK